MTHEFEIPPTWSWRRLEDVARVIVSNVDKKIVPEELTVQLCNYTDVYYNRYIDSGVTLAPGSASDREMKRFQVRVDDVLITKDSEDRHDIAVPALVTEELPGVLCGYHLAIIRPKNGQLDGGFLSALLQCHRTRHLFSRLANGVTRFGLTVEAIEHVRFPLPPFPEQQSISQIVQSCDRGAAAVERLIEKKGVRKRALMQRLLTGKVRFPEFSEPWKTYRLAQLLKPRKEKQTEDADTPLYSLTIEKGVTPKTERYDRGFLVSQERDKEYKRVEPKDIVYNPSNLRWSAIGISREEGVVLVSPIYEVLSLSDSKRFNINFVYHLLSSPRQIRIFTAYGEGTLIERIAVKLKDFLSVPVSIPDLAEQNKIAAALNAADREVDLLRRELEFLGKQKRGLMQKLLTGEKRVKGA